MKQGSTTTPIVMDVSIIPNPGSFGAEILEALKEAEKRDGMKRLLQEQQVEVRTLVKLHQTSWRRFIQHNERRPWFDQRIREDISRYEVIIIRRPHRNAKPDELATWLKTLDEDQRAVVCHIARQEWSEIRRERIERRRKMVTGLTN